jgi:hypothetical protein
MEDVDSFDGQVAQRLFKIGHDSRAGEQVLVPVQNAALRGNYHGVSLHTRQGSSYDLLCAVGFGRVKEINSKVNRSEYQPNSFFFALSRTHSQPAISPAAKPSD